jgi:hypothetical protein
MRASLRGPELAGSGLAGRSVVRGETDPLEWRLLGLAYWRSVGGGRGTIPPRRRRSSGSAGGVEGEVL